MTAILEMKNICKSYRSNGFFFGAREKHQVLKKVHLELAAGSCAGILGRSGSGKSTMGRLLLDIESPDSGEILYKGRNIRHLSKTDYLDYRKNVQVVFQNPLGSVNPRLTAGQIIAEPLENFEGLTARGLEAKIGELLELVGLPHSAADKFPLEFSGGELQRICIARAIALNPEIIVLDEAISSLDMLIQARIIQLLIRLQKELGMTYLFISHDIRVLMKISDRLYLMDRGSLTDQTPAMENPGHPAHPAFGQLLGAILPPLPRGDRRIYPAAS